ncbi:hypothetical protein Scep_023156 [Stephania cephalantha]|uniref:Uncharacterized protein n=1 Tax=Stephania cephalantha TaxID=152367 RepID=A0AAP0EU65_9MAGN
MGWGNIFRRRMKVFTLALVVYFDYKALQQREKWFSKSKSDLLWEKAHERNAKRVLNLIIELEGLWVKLGQYLSTRADVLPQAYINLLKQLQDSLPPRPLQEVCDTIQKELGKSVHELFLKFVESPLATASIAQVHRATLKSGQEVVVKVQHEGIKSVILEDLKNAKSIVNWIAWAEPQYDFNPMIDEWCKEAPKELDFDNEAENTRKVSKNLCRGSNDDNPQNHVDVLIPEVIQSSEKVLILEYMDGIRLNDQEALRAHGVDKQKIVEEITRAYAHQIYIDGFFNGDPHPGNFLVSKEAPHRPILLDFGLTKKISDPMKHALAKMFLASCEGDHVALLSAFAEMGLKLRLDMPDQAMTITNVFFRASTPASEALETMKSLSDQRAKSMQVIQEKMKLDKKQISRFNPVDAFPGDAVIFGRVLNLLRGLSSTMNVRVIYLDIMRPFAESVLQGGNIKNGPSANEEWIYNSPIHSDVEAKLRQLLVKLGDEERILGIQVCAYKDGEVVIDTAAGMLGRYDPRPVQPDSLFPVFSVSKGITAGMLHWLVDKGKLKFEETISNIWPEFGTHGKDQIKVHHVLNHTSGLHNAMAGISKEDPLLMSDWDECLNRVAASIPETEPGREQLYHFISFGWLCGGIMERASGKKFQEILNEAIVFPLNIEGEMYIGIPPGKIIFPPISPLLNAFLSLLRGSIICLWTASFAFENDDAKASLDGVESRLATLTVDMQDINLFSANADRPELPSSFQPSDIIQSMTTVPALFNSLNIRRAIIPAANGHCSARALARYYAALATGGVVPPSNALHSSEPPLGSHPHIPKFPSLKKNRSKKKADVTCQLDPRKARTKKDNDKDYVRIPIEATTSTNSGATSGTGYLNGNVNRQQDNKITKMFENPKVHDAFLGLGDYEHLVLPQGKFGLGFKKISYSEGSLTSFGHSGMGGSTGFCDIKHNFAIAVTLNKMSLGTVTKRIVELVCTELNIPVPIDFEIAGERGADIQKVLGKAVIN